MSNINVTFTEMWVLWLMIPALILTVIPIFFLKKKRRRSLKYISSLLMRSVAMLLALLLLSGFTVTSKSELSSVVIVMDLSDSASNVREEMKSFINGFVKELDKSTQVAMVGFGYNTVTEVPMDFLENAEDIENYYHIKKFPFPSSTATNIDGAMEFAAELLPDGTNKRLVLLSDGLETDGYAEVTARKLANDGIRVDVVEFDSYDPDLSEVQIKALDIPENAYTGDPITATVTLESNIEASVTVNLYDGEELIAETAADIVSGENTVEIETTAGISGVHSYKVEVICDSDTVTVNNIMYTYVKVAGEPSILIVDGTTDEDDAEESDWQEAHEMVKLLEAVDYRCTVVVPDDFPRTLAALRDYDEILLMNVDMLDMPKDSDELLKEYVSRLGRGLFTTGGDNTYIYGSMENSAMEDMLPINMRLDQDELPSTALVILLDNSSSMSGSRLTMAKEGAIKSINSLADKDFVSVITFAEESKVVFGLTSMYEHESIIENVADIRLSQGTKLYSALEKAYDELKDFEGVDQKQVLILSDGEPSDTGHEALVKKMKDDGIVTSTVVVSGTFGANENKMRQLAEVYGGGKCYVVRDVDDLPNIMLDATLAGKGNYVNEITFTPEVEGYSQVLTGVAEIPQLDGYISASVKDHATTVLDFTDPNTGNSRPIYAEWQYGLGRVASFTSDLAGVWSSKWLGADTGVTFVRNVASSLLPAENERSSLETDITVFSRTAEITVTTDDTYGDKILEATVYAPGAVVETPVEMTMTSPGVYTGSVKIEKEGVFTLMLWQFDPAAEDPTIPVDSTEQAFCVSYSSEYDVFAEPTELMTNIAMLTGGMSAMDPNQLAKVPAIPMEDVIDTFTPIAIVIAVLLLLDILIRKLKWKDIAHVFISIGRGIKKIFDRKPKEA